MDGITFNNQPINLLPLMEKALEKMLHITELFDRMHANCKVYKQQVEESFLAWEDQAAEEGVEKGAMASIEYSQKWIVQEKKGTTNVDEIVEERIEKAPVKEKIVAMPTETDPKEITPSILKNPNPKLNSKISDFHLRLSFPSFPLRKYFLFPSFSSVILCSNHTMTEDGPTIRMDRGTRWEFDPGGVYFYYLYSSSHADSLLQPFILALDSTYAKVVESVLDCTFNLFSLNPICAKIDRPSPSSNNTSSVYKMIDGLCRSAGLGEEAIELGVLHVFLSAVRFPRVLIWGDSLVHVVRTCYNVYLGGLNGIKSLWGILDPLALEEGILERYPIFLDPILNHISDWLEGYLARKMMLGLAFGAFPDPVADKLMVAATLVLLCTRPVEIPMFGQVPWLWAVPSILQIGKKRFVHYLFDILPLKVVFKPFDRGGKINSKSKVPFYISSIWRPQEEFSIMVNNSNQPLVHVWLQRSEDGQRFIPSLENLFVLDFVDKDIANVNPVKPLPIESTPFKLMEEVKYLKELAAKLRGVNVWSVGDNCVIAINLEDKVLLRGEDVMILHGNED